MITENEREKIRKRRSERILKYVKNGNIVELGCGSGATISVLSKKFKESTIVGVDILEKALYEVNAKKWENVIPIRADITTKILKDSTFDTAILKLTLHEVYSVSGSMGIANTLKNSYDILKQDGVLIIFDHLKPYPEKVKMKIKDKKVKSRFTKFVKDFKPRKIEYEIDRKGWVVLEKADCLEFLSKCYITDPNDWKKEMREVHYFYTLDEYKKFLADSGFLVETEKKYKLERKLWEDKLSAIDVNFKTPESYVLLIAHKSNGA